MVALARRRPPPAEFPPTTNRAVLLAQKLSPTDPYTALWWAVLLDAFLSATWSEYIEYTGSADDRFRTPRVRFGRTVRGNAAPRLSSRRLREWLERVNEHRSAARWFEDRAGGCPEVCTALGLEYETTRDLVHARLPEVDGRWRTILAGRVAEDLQALDG